MYKNVYFFILRLNFPTTSGGILRVGVQLFGAGIAQSLERSHDSNVGAKTKWQNGMP